MHRYPPAPPNSIHHKLQTRHYRFPQAPEEGNTMVIIIITVAVTVVVLLVAGIMFFQYAKVRERDAHTCVRARTHTPTLT